MGEEFIRRIMVLGLVPSLGPVILFDDIEDLLKWAKSGTGGDDLIEKSTTEAYNKAASLHIKTRVTNPADGDDIVATRKAYSRPGRRYRLECLFKFVDDTVLERIRFDVTVRDGTYEHRVRLQHLFTTNKWQYFNSAGAYADVSADVQDLCKDGWHRFLMEFDQNSGTYLRLVCDSREDDLSALSYQRAGAVNVMRLWVGLSIETVGAAAAECYFDDVLVMEI